MMKLPKNAAALACGFIVSVVCALTHTVVTEGKFGTSWPATSVLLGFVSLAVFTANDYVATQGRPSFPHRVVSIASKAAAAWSLCFGLSCLPFATFMVALAVSVTLGLLYAVTGFDVVTGLLAAATLALCASSGLSNAGVFVSSRGTCATFLGGFATVTLAFGSYSEWCRREGFVSVILLGIIGVVQNIVSPTGRNSKLLLTSPLVLFALGVALRFFVSLGTYRGHPVLFLTGVMIGTSSCFFFQVAVLPKSLWGLLALGIGVTCTILLVVRAAKSVSKTDTVLSNRLEPALLFAKSESSGSESFNFRRLLSNSREGKLAVFFLLTVAVMVLEFLYGISVNSLGLVSDSFHMMLDAASIAIGLCAASAASWKPNANTHPFGFGRYEVLGGFVNGVLLLFIAFYVMVESVTRILDPPEIDAAYLLLVSVIGLAVNIVGVLFFHDSHGHSHSHDHGHDGCGSHHVDHNMRGVYLHILADLLGSVSVIVSSIFIYFFNFWVADPICSALSAGLILASAFPLLEETGKVLLLAAPPSELNFCEDLKHALSDKLEEVHSVKLWMHSTAPRELLFCALSGRMKQNLEYSATRSAVLHFTENKISQELHVDNVNVILNLE